MSKAAKALLFVLAIYTLLCCVFVLQAAPTKIVFWGPTQFNDLIIKPFNESQNQYEAVFENVTTNDAIITKLAAGQKADVVFMSRPYVFSWMARGIAQPIDNFIKRDNYSLQDFLGWTLDEMRYNGHISGLPYTTDVRALYYNKQLFSEVGIDPNSPPKTWSEAEQYNRQLTRLSADGVLERVGLVPQWGEGSHLWLWINSNSAEVVSSDSKKILFNNPRSLEVLQWLADTTVRYGGEAKLTNLTTKGHVLLRSYAAMYVEGSWFYTTVQNANLDINNFGTSSIPLNDSNLPGTSLSAGYGLVLFPGNNPEGAWDLIKYANKPDIACRFLLSRGEYPVRSSFVGYSAYAEFLRSKPFTRPLLNMTAYSRFFPRYPDFGYLQTQMRELVKAVISGKIPPNQALAETSNKYQQTLDEWWSSLK